VPAAAAAATAGLLLWQLRAHEPAPDEGAKPLAVQPAAPVAAKPFALRLDYSLPEPKFLKK
jgi:hypothetical protein